MLNAPQSRISIMRKLLEFTRTESAGGIIMLVFAALALICANSPLSGSYFSLLDAPFSGLALKDWVKDVLMVLFFLLVGMELKREMAEGLLSSREQAIMPFFAALGGMAVPAIIYAAFNHSTPETSNGWAIPSATDIAFALCVLNLFGKHAPGSMKIILLAIAIFDDLGAIIIIALFYNTKLHLVALLFSVAGFLALLLLNRFHISRITPYILTGIGLWFGLHGAGIHTTIAGVAVGMAIPLRDIKNPLITPLSHCMHVLHPYVSFAVLPLFAFASAGVSLSGITLADLHHPMTLGIVLGLFVGKQLGIFGTIFLLVKAGFAKLPHGVSWKHIYAISLLAGIGFTMSLFISLLAFTDPHFQEMAKLGVMLGSLLSALCGAALLHILRERNHKAG